MWAGAIFLINLPIIAVLLLLIPRVIPDDKSTSSQRIDVLGAVLVTAMVLVATQLNHKACYSDT
jgi:DHA2 family multidrug resistance protein-like MFS transporter